CGAIACTGPPTSACCAGCRGTSAGTGSRSAGASGVATSELYDTRFSAAERRAKDAVWRGLCADFFQRLVAEDATVLDLGAGFCEFVNHIRGREKWAVDTDPRLPERAAPDVHVHPGPAHDLGWRETASVDVVFASNVFEHFRTKDDVLRALEEVVRV